MKVERRERRTLVLWNSGGYIKNLVHGGLLGPRDSVASYASHIFLAPPGWRYMYTSLTLTHLYEMVSDRCPTLLSCPEYQELFAPLCTNIQHEHFHEHSTYVYLQWVCSMWLPFAWRLGHSLEFWYTDTEEQPTACRDHGLSRAPVTARPQGAVHGDELRGGLLRGLGVVLTGLCGYGVAW